MAPKILMIKITNLPVVLLLKSVVEYGSYIIQSQDEKHNPKITVDEHHEPSMTK